MSLINQMLQDLDARKVAHGSASGLPNDVRPLPRSAPTQVPYVVGAVLLLVALAALAAFYSGAFSGKVEPAGMAAIPPVEAALPPAPSAMPSAIPASGSEVATAPAAAPTDAPVPSQPSVTGGELQALDLSLRMADFLDLTAEKTSEEKPAPASKAAMPSKLVGKPEASESRKPRVAESGKLESTEPRKREAAESVMPERNQPAPLTAETPASHPLIEKTDAQGTPREKADGEYRKAITLVNQGRIEDALAGLRNALRLDPLHQTARQLSVKLLLEAKRTEEAEQTLAEGIQRQPAQLAWAMTLARLQVDRGDLAGAWQTLNYSQPAAGGNADYQGFSGHVLQRLGRHKEAIERYLAAARLAPDDGRWWLGLGLSLESDGRTGEAREAFEHARKGGNLSTELLALVEQKLK